VRETAEEGLARGDKLISHLDDAAIEAAQKVFRAHGFGRTKPHGGASSRASRQSWKSAPTYGRGSGWSEAGAGTALVGDPQTVAARMREYMALGIDSFILSGYPHLEEAYRFAELVFFRCCRSITLASRKKSARTWGLSARPSPISRGPPNAGKSKLARKSGALRLTDAGRRWQALRASAMFAVCAGPFRPAPEILMGCGAAVFSPGKARICASEPIVEHHRNSKRATSTINQPHPTFAFRRAILHLR